MPLNKLNVLYYCIVSNGSTLVGTVQHQWRMVNNLLNIMVFLAAIKLIGKHKLSRVCM